MPYKKKKKKKGLEEARRVLRDAVDGDGQMQVIPSDGGDLVTDGNRTRERAYRANMHEYPAAFAVGGYEGDGTGGAVRSRVRGVQFARLYSVDRLTVRRWVVGARVHVVDGLQRVIRV